MIYTDTRGWSAVEKPLYDPVIGLTGRPDYLVKKGKDIIPVEVKTSRTPEAPYDSHIFQLAAYCLLVARGILVERGGDGRRLQDVALRRRQPRRLARHGL